MTETADPGNGRAVVRRVRSYVLREGRLTRGQEQALETHWPRFGVEWLPRDGHLPVAELFATKQPVTLEIGFGMGTSLLEMASAEPQRNFLGVEVHRPGVGRLLIGAAAAELQNLRVLSVDAVELLKLGIAPASLDRIQIYFPDPWPKKKHHKRRIMNARFLGYCHAALAAGGTLMLATDWATYAEDMLVLLEEHPGFRNDAPEGGFAPSPWQRPLTKFEERGLREGRRIHDLAFTRLP